MQPSQVRLEHYHLTALSITPIENYTPDFDGGLYPGFNNANFSIGVRLGEAEQNNEVQFMVRLDLSASPKKDASFPYEFDISAEAIVSFHGIEDDPAKLRELVLVNGASLLYGALREVVLTLTSRFPNAPVMLPSADFRTLPIERKSAKKVPKTNK